MSPRFAESQTTETVPTPLCAIFPFYGKLFGISGSYLIIRIVFGQIIVGTKGDLEPESQVTDTEAVEYAKSLGTEYILTSAKSGYNVEEAFAALIRKVRRESPATTYAYGDGAQQRVQTKKGARCVLQ